MILFKIVDNSQFCSKYTKMSILFIIEENIDFSEIFKKT